MFILQINVTFSLKIKHSAGLRVCTTLRRGLRFFATFEGGLTFLQAKIRNLPAPKDLFLTPPLLGLENVPPSVTDWVQQSGRAF